MERPKSSGLEKTVPTDQGKKFKSKLRQPKRLRKVPGTSKEEEVFSAKSFKGKNTDTQPESEEAEVMFNLPLQKEKNSGVGCSKSNKETPVEEIVILELQNEEQQAVPKESENKEPLLVVVDDEPIELRENEIDSPSSSQHKNCEEPEEPDIVLCLDSDDSPIKMQHEHHSQESKGSKQENKEKSAQIAAAIEINKNGTHETDDLPSESQTDTESHCSVTVHDSTKSEISETSEAVYQVDCEAQKAKEKADGAPNIEDWFVSYDPTIMLKDVQIKLNDCLKDNSKVADNGESGTPSRDLSFGKTLRSISARQSIGRMRHVTLREYRPSPDSSLFVNTSNASLMQDEMGDYKILRYNSALSDPASTTNGNSTPADRKRKLETEGWDSMKKSKTSPENSSFLNTSFSMLKGLRRPVQVSTPVAEYKFSTSKLNISGIQDESKLTNEPTEGTKKWCVIM